MLSARPVSAGVPLAVKAEEVSDPVGETLVGLGPAEGGESDLAQPVEQARG
jgi:hypothetical protein